LSLEPQLNYSTQISKGTLDVIGGASLQKQSLDAMQLQATGYNTDLLINNIAGEQVSPCWQGYNAYTYKYSAILAGQIITGKINICLTFPAVMTVPASLEKAGSFTYFMPQALPGCSPRKTC